MRKFENYINNNNNNIEENSNVILYSNNNYNNYCNSLNFIKKQSISNLKYTRKITLHIKSNDYVFNISDIHLEVDFELLGVDEYNIFFELFNHIKENILLNNKIKYILCINFNNINKELLEVFYTFLNETHIKFILLTNCISFISQSLLDNIKIYKIKNISESEYNKTYYTKVENLCNIILKKYKISIFDIRQHIYDLLIYNYNIHDCMSYLFELLIKNNYINDDNIIFVFKNYKNIIEKYNNNYRSIFHIERFIIFLINLNNKV